MQQDSVDQLAATRINDLVASGLINSQDAGLIMKRADESKGLTYEESLRGFLFDRMNPQQKDSQPDVVIDEQTNKALELATKNYETASRVALESEDPKAQAAADSAYKVVQKLQKKLVYPPSRISSGNTNRQGRSSIL